MMLERQNPPRRGRTPLVLQRRAGAIIAQLREKGTPAKTAIARGFTIATRALQREGLFLKGTHTLTQKGKQEEAKLRRRVGRAEWEARFERALRKNRGLVDELPRWVDLPLAEPTSFFPRLEALGRVNARVGELLEDVLATPDASIANVLVTLDSMEALYEAPEFVAQVLEAL